MSKLIGEFLQEVNQDPQRIVSCGECKGTNILFDPEMGEKICQCCGIVLAEKIESTENEINFNTENSYTGTNSGLTSSLSQADRGLSTVIPNTITDGNGLTLSLEQRNNMLRIRRWNIISDSNRRYHRNLKMAFAILLRIRDKLSLSEPVTEKAAYYYRKIFNLNIIKGRSIVGFVVACTYIACKEAGALRSMAEISNVVDTNSVFAGKCYRLMVRRLRIQIPETDRRVILTRISNNADVSQKSLRKALNMLSIIKKNTISYGKDPSALAVAVLYGACLANGEKIGQSKLAEAANTSVVTLRKRMNDVKKIFPDVPIKPLTLD